MFSLLKPIHGGLAELVKEVEEHIKCTSLDAVCNLKGENVSTLDLITIPIFGHTLLILSFRTDSFGQTVQTQITLLIEEQSDQGLHCLLFHLHL